MPSPLSAFEAFYNTPLSQRLRRTGSPEEAALALFHRTAARVPAYRHFLAAHSITPESIRTFEDFQQLPLLTKGGYIRAYSLPERCLDGRLDQTSMIAVSSGSTGVPLFWPRTTAHELDIATRFEQVFHDSFRADERRTLAVVCFTMGAWVGGMFTAACCRHLSDKGYPLTLVTPGASKPEIERCVQELGPLYDQVVLLGYPPFLKDAIDTGIAHGIDWRSLKVRLVMAGEVFSEEWRSLVGDRLGSSDACCDSASLYGTADAGVLGNETPLSITIRRFLSQHPGAARQLFGESRLPTLVQYDPFSRFFETHQGTLLFSGDSGVPLIRYHIADTGSVVPFEKMLQFLQDWKFNPLAELSQTGEGPVTGSAQISGDPAPGPATRLGTSTGHQPRGIHPLPFVYVFGRSDFTVSYFGANIYPENVTVGLESQQIQSWTTGKFVLSVEEDEDKNRHLAVVVELLPDLEPAAGMSETIAESIRQSLVRLNSEFANYVPAAYQQPRVRLAPAGDPDHFPAGVKHRYTRRPTASNNPD